MTARSYSCTTLTQNISDSGNVSMQIMKEPKVSRTSKKPCFSSDDSARRRKKETRRIGNEHKFTQFAQFPAAKEQFDDKLTNDNIAGGYTAIADSVSFGKWFQHFAGVSLSLFLRVFAWNESHAS